MSDDDYNSDNSSSDDSDTGSLIGSVKKTPLFKPKNYVSDSDEDTGEDTDEDTDDDKPDDDKANDDKPDENNVSDDYDEKDQDESDEDEELDETGEPIVKDPIKKANKLPKQLMNDDDDDDDDYEDDNYLQKFDNDIIKNYVNDFHPECLNHNYDEISKLSIVVRNKENIIVDPLHRTIPYLTKYEKARILGQRAKQIETGSKPLVKIPENIVDSYIIAELELREKKIPFIIRRPIPGGSCEYWNLKDLEMIAF